MRLSSKLVLCYLLFLLKLVAAEKIPIDNQLGQTYYVIVENECWKIDLFPTGSVAVDLSNLDCTSEGNSSNFQTLSHYQSSSNDIAYFNMDESWSGVVYFSENMNTTKTSALIKKSYHTHKNFEIEISLPISSNGPTISPNCWMDLFLGQTLYFDAVFFCMRVQFFPTGNAALDRGNYECTVESASSDLLILGLYQNSTNRKSFFTGDWTGEIYFLEDSTVADTKTQVINFDTFSKQFELLVLTPHCAYPSSAPSEVPSNEPTLSTLPSSIPSTNPSTIPSSVPSLYPTISSNCWTGIFYGKTLFLKLDFFCLRIDLYPNGNLSIDRQNLDCTIKNASTDVSVLATYQYSTNKAVFYHAGTIPNGWTADIYFTQDMTMTEVKPVIETLDGLLQILVLQVQFPHCAFPSSIPSAVPSLFPSSLPSAVPSNFPSNYPTSKPTLIPSLFPTNTPSIVPTLKPTSSPSTSPSDYPLSSPSSIPTSAPSISENCNQDKFLGKTYFFQILIMCVKAELFPNGTIAIDPFDANCILENTALKFQILSYYQYSTNKISVFNSGVLGSKGWNGQIFFTENNEAIYEEIHLLSFDVVDQYFTVEIVLPSCNEPSSLPSISPTLFPTSLPSQMPSEEPSIYPSGMPSELASNTPSIHPSGKPTEKPSDVPTTNPSVEPSFVPSLQPTMSPSTKPSITPSSIPSSTPSNKPSISPSLYPSINPSSSPSYKPSQKPSLEPTIKPTSYPSIGPSSNPSTNPTFRPSIKPSIMPSIEPSSGPSNTPTYVPSLKPSINPSKNPSTIPSRSPSTNPTIEPTFIPSLNPTLKPSIEPSTNPTLAPSLIPSTVPSSVPSFSPTQSAIPSNVPSLFTRCLVEEFLGNIYYATYETAFVRIFYKIHLVENGSFSVNVENIDYMNKLPFGSHIYRHNKDSDFSLVSTFANYTENIAFFEDNNTKWTGYFAIKENPQLDDIEFEFIMYESTSKSFAVELFFPSCVAPSINPTSVPTKIVM